METNNSVGDSLRSSISFSNTSNLYLFLALAGTGFAGAVFTGAVCNAQATNAQQNDAQEINSQEIGAEEKIKANNSTVLSDQSARILAEKDQRIALLEARMERLEKIVFATSKLSVIEAERELTEAQQRLAHSDRLFIKGLIGEIELARDRFAVNRAKRELDLARTSINGRVLTAEIDLMQAKFDLRRAQSLLKRTENLAERGFSSQAQVEGDKRQVEIAKQQLDIAQQKLEAISKEIEPKKQ